MEYPFRRFQARRFGSHPHMGDNHSSVGRQDIAPKAGDNVAINNSVRIVDMDKDFAAFQRLPPFIRDFLMYEMPSSADMARMEEYIKKYGEKKIFEILHQMRDKLSLDTYGPKYPKLGRFKIQGIQPKKTGRG